MVVAVTPKDQQIRLSSQEQQVSLNPLRGELHSRPARYVIDQLHKDKATGTLLLSFKDKRKKLWFSKGQLIRLQSNLVPELSGKMMVERDWINEADLRQCLEIQREANRMGSNLRLIGEIVGELHGVDRDEVKAMIEQQTLNSFVQALTWDNGSFEFSPMEFRTRPTPILDYGQLVDGLQSLFEVQTTRVGDLFEKMDLWTPERRQVELSQMPLWMILAGARKLDLNGIISVRRQNRLYEIILKYGIPLTLYEGTFGQPRQTIVVRQASDDHEKFFVEQLFKLFSFLTGVVHYRDLKDQRSPAQANAEVKEETQVTKSVRPDDLVEDTGLTNIAKAYLRRLRSISLSIKKSLSRQFIKWSGQLQVLTSKLLMKLKRR